MRFNDVKPREVVSPQYNDIIADRWLRCKYKNASITKTTITHRHARYPQTLHLMHLRDVSHKSSSPRAYLELYISSCCDNVNWDDVASRTARSIFRPWQGHEMLSLSRVTFRVDTCCLHLFAVRTRAVADIAAGGFHRSSSHISVENNHLNSYTRKEK